MSATTTTTTTTATKTTTARASTSSVTIPMSSSNTSHTTLATPTTPTTSAPTTRVRFDAECVLIPDVPFAKRPRMLTKSYSLPLWRKAPRTHEEDERAVLKVALPRCVGSLVLVLLLPPSLLGLHSIPFRCAVIPMRSPRSISFLLYFLPLSSLSPSPWTPPLACSPSAGRASPHHDHDVNGSGAMDIMRFSTHPHGDITPLCGALVA
ncbi:hypothetical protein FB451DRAFT_284429 [Mycena latifolia]|nr:hypothetical protein FB451DRAFT_284429 [Mycena latifolia]